MAGHHRILHQSRHRRLAEGTSSPLGHYRRTLLGRRDHDGNLHIERDGENENSSSWLTVVGSMGADDKGK